MIKKIATSSAYFAGGLSTQRKLFFVPSGAYQGRAIAVYPKTESQIVCVWSDPPYTQWSEETAIITDAANFPPSAHMDESGHVYVAYTVQSSLDLALKKLSFSNGSWSAGSKRTIYDGDSNYYPSLHKDVYSRLWVSFTRESGGICYVNVKRSTDDGVTWGTGQSDPGTALTSGATSCYSQLVYRPSHVYCIYSDGSTKLAYRRMHISGALFDDEVGVYTGADLAGRFCGAASIDLKLGVAFRDGSILGYREFDGSQWSGVLSIDTECAMNPVLYFRQSVPYIVFGKQVGTGQVRPCISHREGASFTAASSVSAEIAPFDKVFCCRPSAAAQFSDKTSAAANGTSADVYHDSTGKLLLSSGDAVYLGQSERFSAVVVTLSTTGAGGTVAWYYWNGTDWKVFNPTSGAYHFGSSPSTIRLWDDTASAPSDWQTSLVNGSAKFWIKAVATSDFTTGPIGSQMTCASNISYLIAA
jgi:hypothetical protein